MKEPIKFDVVADIYDYYVHFDLDFPFFLQETEGYRNEILELMCGTGRVSIPLLKTGRTMTCVDYSSGMLETFAKKIKNKNYNVELVEMDVTKLDLKKKFELILLPFHSLSEILSTDLQRQALLSIASHLEVNGTLILTLQNPTTRLKLADGTTRIMGEFSIDSGHRMIVSHMNQYNAIDRIVSGFQFYEIYDYTNTLIEKRYLEINFKPISDYELKDLIMNLGLEIIDTYGDYAYNPFDEKKSDFIIYKMIKK